MTEEKPLNERTESNEEAATNQPEASGNGNDGIAAALSALSNAAAPERSDNDAEGTRTHDDAAAASATLPNATESAAQTPPPPPAPDAATSYPPPTGAPIAVNAAPVAPVPPAPTGQRKRWPWILALCIVAGLLLIGCVTACASTLMNMAFHAVQHNERYYDYDELFNRDTQDGLWNYYYGGMDATFDDLLGMFNTTEGEITPDGAYARGAYRVGGDNGIAPGLYYLEGSQEGVSNFYVFDGDDDIDGSDPHYSISCSVEYFGNYYTELEEGDAIVFIPFAADDTMHLASGEPMDVMPPYQSGCYRVGIDIPAGTYTITCQTEAARATDSEAGAYIMDDLEFDDDSIIESVYVIKGGRQTITVEAGEYLELFAAIATPATASTKTPLQHAESERHHAV